MLGLETIDTKTFSWSFLNSTTVSHTSTDTHVANRWDTATRTWQWEWTKNIANTTQVSKQTNADGSFTGSVNEHQIETNTRPSGQNSTQTWDTLRSLQTDPNGIVKSVTKRNLYNGLDTEDGYVITVTPPAWPWLDTYSISLTIYHQGGGVTPFNFTEDGIQGFSGIYGDPVRSDIDTYWDAWR